MWRCPRRCRRLSAPNSASTDAVQITHRPEHAFPGPILGEGSGQHRRERGEELARLPFRLRRLAVTEEQIEEWSLPTRPTKRSDSRARSFGSSVSVDLGVAYASTPRGEGGAGTLKFKTK